MKHLKIHIQKFEYQGESILKDIDLTLNKGDTLSIVGPNGSGKTTLLKIITGEIQNFEGSIDNVGNLTLGYLHQIFTDNEEKTVREELRGAFTKIQSMERELSSLETQMASDTSNEVIEKYSSLLEHFRHIGGYEYENKIHQVANGIGILELLDKKLVEISGGQRTKVALAKVLLEEPDMLFLDEPTNFIDMASVEWLEGYLKNKWNGGYIIVSHDREFLDKTCEKTLELQPQRESTLYHCNYSQYVIDREKVEKKKMDEWERQDDYIKKQENLIDRFRAGSRSGWAKSREKMIDKMEKVDKPFIPRKPKFFFDYSGESSDKLVQFKEAFIGREEALFFIQEATLHK